MQMSDKVIAFERIKMMRDRQKALVEQTKLKKGILPLFVQNVTYTVGPKIILNDVSFCLTPGKRTIILGPNGAGKSVLLRLCHGLLQPVSGSISWQGEKSSPLLEKNEHLIRQGFVFQSPVILRRSVAANIRYVLKLHSLARKEIRHRIDLALRRTGLEKLAGQAARTLSLGERQRLALARIWALNPEVVFLDEPTANLDPTATNRVEGIINRMHHDGAKIIMTTHDISQAQRLADEVLFLYRGQLSEHTPADIFFAAPQTDEARAFLSGRLFG